MVVLADEVLESFFETDLSASFRLEPVSDMELPMSGSGFLGDLWSNIATDTNKKMFNKLTDELGKTIGRHQASLFLLLVFLDGTEPAASTGHSPSLHRTIYQARRTQGSRIVAHRRDALLNVTHNAHDTPTFERRIPHRQQTPSHPSVAIVVDSGGLPDEAS
jgi:hypothetical protein